MKKCKKCGNVKNETEFYGVQGECKTCTKIRVKERYNNLIRNPDYVENERKRCRDKYFRLYVGKKQNPEIKKKSMKNYKEKYPEKYRAKKLSQRIKPPIGFEKHHWNYNEGFEKDVLFMTNEEHNLLHRYSIYDQERMMYRKLNGELLDSMDKLKEYFWNIKKDELDKSN